MTTIHLNPPRARLSQVLPMPVLIALVVFALLAGSALIGNLSSSTTAAAVPTPALPIIIIQKEPAQPQPTAAAAQVAVIGRANVLPRAVVAYDAPEGKVIGAIEAGRPYRVVAASAGALWLQADVENSGMVWLNTAELYGIATPDLPTPQTVYVSSPQPATAPIAPDRVSQPAGPPQPSTEPHSAPVELTAEQQAAVDNEFGLTDDDRARALDQHQAQQLAWCADKVSEYCDLVRSASR